MAMYRCPRKKGREKCTLTVTMIIPDYFARVSGISSGDELVPTDYNLRTTLISIVEWYTDNPSGTMTLKTSSSYTHLASISQSGYYYYDAYVGVSGPYFTNRNLSFDFLYTINESVGNSDDILLEEPRHESLNISIFTDSAGKYSSLNWLAFSAIHYAGTLAELDIQSSSNLTISASTQYSYV